MDIVVIFNGLGNQMSQYAFYMAKKRYNDKCIFIFDDKGVNNHNGYELEKLFGIKRQQGWKVRMAYFFYGLKKTRGISRLLKYLGVRIITDDEHYSFREENVKKSPIGISLYWGGWPSELHFSEVSDEVKNVFSFPEQKDEQFLKWKREILGTVNSVSIHIRRGDYLTQTNDRYQFGGVATDEYFKKAINYICNKTDKPVFYVFSDDLEWCKEQFKGDEYRYVDCNRGMNSWRDMYMMSLCRHHINSNSTFSWWGAWLSDFENSITICPKEYIRGLVTPDVYPERWVKL